QLREHRDPDRLLLEPGPRAAARHLTARLPGHGGWPVDHLPRGLRGRHVTVSGIFRGGSSMRRLGFYGLVLLALVLVHPRPVHAGCADLLQFLPGQAADVVCFDSPDLTTKNISGPPTGPTTPANNSLPGLPAFAFTPITDRGVISPDPPNTTPVTKAV